jgi:hypothetical protein
LSEVFNGANRVGASVETYDATVQEELQTAMGLLWAHATCSKEASAGPVLIKHAVSHWPALHLWSLDWLARKYPNHRFVCLPKPLMFVSIFVWIECKSVRISSVMLFTWFDRTCARARACVCVCVCPIVPHVSIYTLTQRPIVHMSAITG